MSEWLLVTLTVVAVYRITRLLAVDRITRSPREKLQWWFEKRWERKTGFDPSVSPESDEWQSMAAYLLSCPWCVSIWVGIPIVWAVDWFYGLPAPILVWMTASAVSGLLSTLEKEDLDDWNTP